MHILRRRGWEIAGAPGDTGGAGAGPPRRAGGRRRAGAGRARPGADWPGRCRAIPKYVAGRDITPEKYATTYNNYYEFSESKNLWQAAQAMKHAARGRSSLAGMVKQPRTIAIDDLLKQVQLEERVYRHRCVEAWAMTVPWTGFPLSQLLKIAEPLGSAKYFVFETAQDKTMPGLQSPFYPWPYIDGLAIDEAANDLAFISTGHVRQAAAAAERRADPADDCRGNTASSPCKALAKISFTDKRPVNFWQAIQPSEYGFWANVNPDVAHPRWSQAQRAAAGQQRDGANADLQRLW